RAVVIDEARLGRLEGPLVEELADVLFQMESLDADDARRPVDLDLETAVFGQRLLVLGDLVVLRHVRVVVVFAREAARVVHATVERERGADAELDRAAVDDGKHARHSLADRARLAVRRRPEGRRTAAEHLRPREELRVDLEADDGLHWSGGRETGFHRRWPAGGAVWLRGWPAGGAVWLRGWPAGGAVWHRGWPARGAAWHRGRPATGAARLRGWPPVGGVWDR